jgi:hypothetical protein
VAVWDQHYQPCLSQFFDGCNYLLSVQFPLQTGLNPKWAEYLQQVLNLLVKGNASRRPVMANDMCLHGESSFSPTNSQIPFSYGFRCLPQNNMPFLPPDVLRLPSDFPWPHLKRWCIQFSRVLSWHDFWRLNKVVSKVVDNKRVHTTFSIHIRIKVWFP